MNPPTARQQNLCTYTDHECRRFYDLREVFIFSTKKVVQVEACPGQSDLTNWKCLIKRYGKSTVKRLGDKQNTKLCDITAFSLEGEYTVNIVDERTHLTWFDKQQEWNRQAQHLERIHIDQLEILWNLRKSCDIKTQRKHMRTQIWQELERRYPDSRTPMEVQIDEHEQLDYASVKRDLIKLLRTHLKGKEWPDFLINWHCSRFRVKTLGKKSIANILHNVTSCKEKRCSCAQIQQRLEQAGMRTKLPCINGHILCIGREYEGPYKKVMSMPNMNIPIGSRADLQRTIDIAYDKLERQFCTKSEWRSVCTQACKTYIKQRRDTPVPTKYEAYRLKQLLKGLVLGPLDKNNGETWAMCPILYQEGLTNC